MTVPANVLYVDGLTIEVIELPDETPAVILVVNAHNDRRTYDGLHAFAMPCDATVLGLLAGAVAAIGAVIADGHVAEPLDNRAKYEALRRILGGGSW